MKNWYESYDVVEHMNGHPEYTEKIKCEDDRETETHKKNVNRRKRGGCLEQKAFSQKENGSAISLHESRHGLFQIWRNEPRYRYI